MVLLDQTTDDKQKAVWRVYQQSVLEYCRDAILKESVRTLSDERTTSPDDAEAKYARVVGSALLTIASVLGTLQGCAICKADAECLRYPVDKRAPASERALSGAAPIKDYLETGLLSGFICSKGDLPTAFRCSLTD